MFRYKYRPGHRSKKLLIEFCGDFDDQELLGVLFALFKENGVKEDGLMDLWMNDEMIIMLSGAFGKFMVSNDVWGFVFVMADANPEGIGRIEQLLSNGERFQSEPVNFEDYRLSKK